MCLDYVDPEIKKTKGYGWKVFRNKIDGLKSLYYSKQTPYPIKKWITDRRKGNVFGHSYPKGFHIYAIKPILIGWEREYRIVCKVEFKDVVATGRQNRRKVIVARKIFIEDKL